MNKKFDLIITNSILHHIPVPENLIGFFFKILKVNGYYLCGHEPNRSFYFNPKTTRLTTYFRLYKKLYKRFNIKYIKRKTGLEVKASISQLTNHYLIDKGIINKPIPTQFLIKLIDIHVPLGNKKDQCWGKIGFDKTIFNLRGINGDIFEVISYKTYSHIKDPLSNKFWFWRKVKANLALEYPDDGGDYVAVVKKSHIQG